MTPAAATALVAHPTSATGLSGDYDTSDPIHNAVVHNILADMVWHDLSADEKLSDADCEPARDEAFAAASLLAHTEPTTLRGVWCALRYTRELDPGELPDDFYPVLLNSLDAALDRLLPSPKDEHPDEGEEDENA